MKVFKQSILFATFLLLIPKRAVLGEQPRIYCDSGQQFPSSLIRDRAMAPTCETVSGTVTYRERIALPQNAIVQVSLESVGAPLEVLAEQTIETQGKQVPIPFILNYDASKVQEEKTYVLRAQILVDQELRFAGEMIYPTAPNEKPARVEIIVRSVNPSPRSSKASHP